jgi:hypothetical protein
MLWKSYQARLRHGHLGVLTCVRQGSYDQNVDGGSYEAASVAFDSPRSSLWNQSSSRSGVSRIYGIRLRRRNHGTYRVDITVWFICFPEFPKRSDCLHSGFGPTSTELCTKSCQPPAGNSFYSTIGTKSFRLGRDGCFAVAVSQSTAVRLRESAFFPSSAFF